MLVDRCVETVSTNPEIKAGFTLNSEKSILSGTVAADNSLVLKVFIDRNTYTFTTVIDGVSTETKYYYGSMISGPDTPIKEDYKFMGWDTEIPSTMPAENMTITAKWRINQYTITFDTAGGSDIASIIQDFDTAIVKPE